MTELKFKDDRKERRVRAPLSQKLRFEVLKRDGFTCQYCGLHTGDGKQLEIDHITPVSKGGTNDIGNLLTACKECNRGKLTDEILAQYTEDKVVDKVVERVEYKEQNHVSSPIIDFIRTSPTSHEIDKFIETKAYERIAEECKFFGKRVSEEFAIKEMLTNGDKIKEWATQDNNLTLKYLACEVLTVAGKEYIIR